MSYRKVFYPACRLLASSTQSIGSSASASPTILNQFGTVLETNPIYTPTSSGVVINKPGIYNAHAHINFPGAAGGGYRLLGIFHYSSRIGGSEIKQSVMTVGPFGGGNWFGDLSHDCIVSEPGQFIAAGFAHDVGSTQTMNGGGATWFYLRRIGDIE